MSGTDKNLFISIDNFICAIPYHEIVSMIRMVSLRADSHLEGSHIGTLNNHGKIIPVFSLRSLLNLPLRKPGLNDKLIIVQYLNDQAAIWVDDTSIMGDFECFLSFDPDLITLLKSIHGIELSEDGKIIIHDISALLHFLETYPVKEKNLDGSSQISSLFDNLDPDIHAILTERAQDIAKPEEKIRGEKFFHLLKFSLLYKEYAIDMDMVREVIRTRTITPVPGTPDFIAGICPVRGEIISLVDLKELLSISEKGLTDFNQVIVLTNGDITFGILTDEITGLIIVSKEEVTDFVDENQSTGHFIKGVCPGPVYLLDAATILSDPKMVVEDIDESMNDQMDYAM